MREPAPILLVEEEDSIRAFLLKLLRAEGLEVAAFARADEAMELVRAGVFPAIVLANPDTPPGQALRDELQRDPLLKQVPIVSLAGGAARVVAEVKRLLAARPGSDSDDAAEFVIAQYGAMAARLPRLLARLRELAEQMPGDHSEIDQRIEEARRGGRRLSSWVRYLRDYGHVEDQSTAPTDVVKALEFAIETAHHEVTQCARLLRRIGAAPVVLANERQLSHVFLSLLINAAHSIEPNKIDENEIEVTVVTTDGGWVKIEVRDSGSGIAPEILPRIWEPYFSTKRGAGMGLGLVIARTLVEGWGGHISVETEVGRGSRFRVELPPAPPPAEAKA